MNFIFEDMMFLIMLMMSVVLQVSSETSLTGHRLYKLTPTNEIQQGLVEKLKEVNEVDMWNDPIIVNNTINVHIPPDLVEKLEEEWKEEGLEFSIVTSDLQKWVDSEKEANPQDMDLRDPDNIPLNQFHDFETISKFIDTVSEKYSPIAEVQIIGTTYEGNPIKGIKIGAPGVDKPAIWIDAGIHAREWAAPATAVYIIEQLLKGYDTDEEIQDLVDSFDWYIFPVINVDGYKYTFTHNRLWRKNRAVYKNKKSKKGNHHCKGTDPNRNFDSEFGGVGTSDDMCSIIYRGASAFSEAESIAMRDGILNLGDRLKAYFTLHAYGQLWLTPYGRTVDDAPDFADHMKALKVAEVAVSNVHNEIYKYGALAPSLYPSTSNSIDWVYDAAGVKYSFGIELRDKGDSGFFLSNDQIIPTAEENFAGIKAVVNFIKEEIEG